MVISFVVAAAVLGGCGALVERTAAGREAEAERAYPPQGQFLTVEGRRVHAQVAGSGPDLVLIHGASGNTRDFTFRLMDMLSDRYRVIVFDRPGLGWSDPGGEAAVSPLVQADTLRAAAAQLGVKRPIVLGHSYGGAVAMAWALRDPQNTAALVVVSGATMPWPGGLGPQYSVLGSPLGSATVVPLVAAFVSPTQAEQAVRGIFAPDAVPPGYSAHIGVGLSLRRTALRENARQVRGLKPHLERMVGNYSKLTMPVELVHGDADTIVPLDVHSRPLSLLLPDAVLTVIPGAGHMPHQAHPEVVAAAIDRAARRAQLR